MSIRFHQTSELQGCAIEETVWEAINEALLGMGGKYLSFKLNATEASDVSRVTLTETGGFESREMIKISRNLN